MNEYVVRVPIRFSDIDQFGHVNHARYLTYCEDHRTTMLRHLERDIGAGWEDAGFVVARVDCTYRKALSHDDEEVVVGFSVNRIGRTSVDVRYRIRRAADMAEVALVDEVLVLVDGDSSRPVTDAERRWLSRYDGRTLVT